ncbi:MAG: tetratricopeptide repeat protein [Anaerolineae bacterium]|nr:MAG: tetratricopeptide repeat protein [Anaerolineae bacterium]
MADERMMQEAVEAIRNGQRARARDLLTRLLRTETEDADLWLYMSTVVESEKERIFCLESALKIDPQNTTARRGLVMLGAAPPDESLQPIRPQRSREWEIPSLQGNGDEDKPRTRLPVGRLALLGAIGLGAVAVIGYGIFGMRNRFGPGGLAFGPTSTPRPLFAASASPTLEVTDPGPASTAVVNGPTPLVLLLQATYTPTASYVNTPHASDESFRTALSNLARGNYEQALGFMDQFLQNNPDAPDAHYYKGQIYLAMGDPGAALGEFDQTIQLDANFGPAYLGRAQASLALNPDADVERDLERTVELSPDYADGYVALAGIRLDQDDPEAALEAAQQALELNPESPLAFHYIARAQLALGDEVAALEAATRANQLDFTLLDNYLTLGQALVENGRSAEAIGPIQTYLYFHTDELSAWLQLGRAQQEGGYPENAIRIYEYVLSIDRTQYRTYYFRGMAYRTMGDYANAIRDLRAAAQTYREDYRLQMDFAITLHEAGYSGDAYLQIQALQFLVDTDEQWVEFYYWRATTLQAIGEWLAAERDWNTLLEQPEDLVPAEWAAAAVQNLKVVSGTITATPTLTGNRTPTPPADGTETSAESSGTPAATPTP